MTAAQAAEGSKARMRDATQGAAGENIAAGSRGADASAKAAARRRFGGGTAAPMPVSPLNLPRAEALKRLLVMFVGFFCISMGVALLTKSNTGTSAISVIPYTAYILLPQLSYGTWVGMFNGLLVLLQVLLLRRECQLVDLLMQVVFCVSFGVFVDVSMWILSAYNPQAYPLRLATMFAGVVMLALGAYITLVSRVGVGAGDGFARAVCRVTGVGFGSCRVICDTAMMLIAAVLNLIFFQGLLTVREGTVTTALFAGMFVGFFLKALKPLEYAVLPQNRPAE
ncbi:MAG: YitT family protein [Coriobacteriales bacterium]